MARGFGVALRRVSSPAMLVAGGLAVLSSDLGVQAGAATDAPLRAYPVEDVAHPHYREPADPVATSALREADPPRPVATEPVEEPEEEPPPPAPQFLVAVAAPPPPTFIRPAPGSGNGFAYGYCTWWVANKRSIPWRGNAWEWWSNAQRLGFAVGQAPRAGAIMVMGAGAGGASGQGHVAYVESVRSDGSFVVSEMNWGGWGVVNYRTITSRSGVVGFIY